MADITVRGVTLQAADHCDMKIIVPVFARPGQQYPEQVRKAAAAADIVEIRLDEMHSGEECVEYLRIAREQAPNAPLLATVRTYSDGGTLKIDTETYYSWLHIICRAEVVDMIDIEYFHLDCENLENRAIALEHNVIPIYTYHDFVETISEEDLLHNMRLMVQDGDAVAVKLAVMPHNLAEVAELLSIAAKNHQAYPDIPQIMISMGELGAITRACAGFFGCCATFATMEEASAPGQPNVQDLREILKVLGKL